MWARGNKPAVLTGFSYARTTFATLAFGAMAVSGISGAHAQSTVIYKNDAWIASPLTPDPNELPYGGSNDDNALYAINVIGTQASGPKICGSGPCSAWRVSEVELALDNPTLTTFRNQQIVINFYGTMNVNATGSTVVNSNNLFGFDELNNVTIAPGSLLLDVTTFPPGLYIPNATNGATIGVQISTFNATAGGTLTSLNANIHPYLTYPVTVGSNPGTNIWENGNGTFPNTYTGSNALPTQAGGNNYNLLFKITATAVPGPSSLAVLAMGGAPMMGLLRRRRALR